MESSTGGLNSIYSVSPINSHKATVREKRLRLSSIACSLTLSVNLSEGRYNSRKFAAESKLSSYFRLFNVREMCGRISGDLSYIKTVILLGASAWQKTYTFPLAAEVLSAKFHRTLYFFNPLNHLQTLASRH